MPSNTGRGSSVTAPKEKRQEYGKAVMWLRTVKEMSWRECSKFVGEEEGYIKKVADSRWSHLTHSDIATMDHALKKAGWWSSVQEWDGVVEVGRASKNWEPPAVPLRAAQAAEEVGKVIAAPSSVVGDMLALGEHLVRASTAFTEGLTHIKEARRLLPAWMETKQMDEDIEMMETVLPKYIRKGET